LLRCSLGRAGVAVRAIGRLIGVAGDPACISIILCSSTSLVDGDTACPGDTLLDGVVCAGDAGNEPVGTLL